MSISDSCRVVSSPVLSARCHLPFNEGTRQASHVAYMNPLMTCHPLRLRWPLQNARAVSVKQVRVPRLVPSRNGDTVGDHGYSRSSIGSLSLRPVTPCHTLDARRRHRPPNNSVPFHSHLLPNGSDSHRLTHIALSWRTPVCRSPARVEALMRRACIHSTGLAAHLLVRPL